MPGGGGGGASNLTFKLSDIDKVSAESFQTGLRQEGCSVYTGNSLLK